MSEFNYEIDANDAICPYCGNRYQVECEDYDEDARSEECESCGNEYKVWQVITICTHTETVDQINNEEVV